MERGEIKRGIFVSFPVNEEKHDTVKRLSLTFDMQDTEKKHTLIYYLIYTLNAKHTPGNVYVVRNRRNSLSLNKVTGEILRLLGAEEYTLVIQIDPPESLPVD